MSDNVVVIIIAVGGWLATHALSLRAQRRQLRHQVLDRARLDITAGIREYQNWLLRLLSAIRGVRSLPTYLGLGLSVNIRQNADEFSALLKDANPARAWALRLEEYEILFPETRTARIDLEQVHLQLITFILECSTELLQASLGQANVNALAKILGELDAGEAQANDLVALLEDLRVYLQNTTLSEIAGGTVPPRVPLDPSVPVLRRNRGGQLAITRGRPG